MSEAIGTAIIKFVTGATKVNAIVANVVGTATLMVGSRLLTPKARFGNVKERDSLNIRGINSRGATDSRSYIYGQVRVGGTVVYMETTGTDNEFLHMVLVHCDHEVEELGDVYVNDVKVDFDSASEGSLRNAQGTRYRNSLYIADHLGGPSQTVDSTLDTASGKWGSNDKLSGMAYTYIRMELKTGEDNAFPNGIPTFTRVVKGRKVYDPRLDSTQTGIGGSGSQRSDDSTTWEWSDNWALCVADYITSDFGYGRFGNSWSNINVAELDASADNCDETVNQRWTNWSASEDVTEGTYRLFNGTGYSSVLRAESDGTTGTSEPAGPFSVAQTGITDGTTSWQVVHLSILDTESRYTLNGIIEADEDPLEVVKEMKGAAAGFIEYIGGSWVITSGRYQAPTITLTESDFAGPITGSSKDDRTRSINGVRGVIANKDDAYNVIDVPPISSSAYVTEDNDVESFRDLKLLYTTSTSMAQRIFKIELNRARQALAFRSTFTASAFRLKAGDTFSLDFDRYGWSGKIFQVWSTQLKTGGSGELVVDVEFRETASTIYDYTASSDETVVDPAPNTNLPDPFTVTAPTGMAAASGTAQLIETSDGTILPTVLVTWTAAASVNVIGYQIRWRLASESSDQDYRYLTVNGRNNTSSVITGVRESRSDANQYIDIDIRSLTPVKEGEWTVVEHDHDVIGKSAAPTDPSGPTVAAVENGVTVTFSEHPDLDFLNYHIWVQTSASAPTHTGTGPFTPIATTSTSGLTKTILGLDPSTTYYVFTAAMDSSRLFSDIVATTPATISPSAIAAGDVTGLGALATEDTVDLTTTANGGVSGVLPVANSEATDNGTTIDTSGDVNAAIDFTASGAIKHGKTSSDDASNAGFWLGEDGQSTPDYDFHIGDSSNSLKWDGSASTLTVKGDLTAGSVDIGTGFSRTEIASTGVSSWAGGRIQINASDSAFGDVGQKWLGAVTESIWIDCNTSILPANLYFGDVSTGTANAFISGQGNAEFKTLDVTTSLDLNSSTLDASNGVGTSGQVLSSTGSGTQWIDSAASLWTQSASDVYYNTGNVGIGTTTPDADLHVVGDTILGVDAASGPRLRMVGSGSDFYVQASNSSTGGTGTKLNFSKYSSTDTTMTVDTNNETVGIGTTSPNAKLEINGGTGVSTSGAFILRQDGDGSGNGMSITSSNATSHRIWKDSNGKLNIGPSSAASSLVQDVDGNLGLGTASPDSILHLSSSGPTILTIEADTDNVTETDNARIVFKQDGGLVVGRVGYANNTNSLEIINEYAENLFLGTNNGTDFTIDSSGRCGIGTTTPGAELDVEGPTAEVMINSTGSTYSRVKHEHNGTAIWTSGTRASDDYHIYRESGSGDVIIDNANLGIKNASPSAALDVTGEFELSSHATLSSNLYVKRDSDAWTSSTTWINVSDYGVLNTGGSYALTLNGNGYRSNNGDWESFNQNSLTGATQIWQFPAGYITFNANSSWATGSSTTVSERMRIFGDGQVSIGTTSSGYKLRVEGDGYFADRLTLGDVGSEGGELVVLDHNNASTQKLTVDVDSAGNSRVFQLGNGNLYLGNLTGGTGETRLYANADAKVKVKSTQTEITDQLYVSGYSGSDSIVTINGIDCGGGMLVQGSLDVDVNLDVSGSKNFRIAHPVRDGHDLRHTCVESPQADLTYRGQATLVDGTVQVDLDSEFGMTAGTFAALNDDVQVFAQNESGWDAVRGSVSDGVLTIDCENLDSSDSVGWLVIGRRTGVTIDIEPKTRTK